MPTNTKISAQPTADEARRIEVLREYAILDTDSDQALDDLTALAAQICAAPIALISLVDENRQWFKSRVGLETTETPRDISFCGHALHERDLFIVPDATQDERFAGNPLVTGEPRIRFYAGAPLVSPDDRALGTLCVIDHSPRKLTQAQEHALRVLARQVMTHLELRRHEHELAESESKFRLLAENITDVFWIASPDLKRMYYVSPGYELIWGRTAKDLYANPEQWAECILPDEREHVLRVFGTLRDNEPTVSVEYRISRPDGTVRWILDRGFQVRDDVGRLERLTGIAADITERKQMEIATRHVAALVHYSDDAIIGKDLNSIITSWNKGAEKIFGYSADEMVGTSIMRLIPAARHNEEVHIMARIKSGESVEHFETQRMTKAGKLIEISVTASPIKDSAGKIIGVSKVARDITERKRTEQARRESDARYGALFEYAPDGIVIANGESYYIDAKAGRYIVISVADSGTGIARNHLEKIFEPFFTTKELNKGTGLGLSAVVAIAKSHGGFVNVYSELGKGTTFKVYLPVTESSSKARAPHSDKVELPRGNGETVLVIDDEASILTITSQTLQAFGYRVITAADGADALAIYVEHKKEIAVVVTDMMMPVMGGAATIQALIRINPNVKIIAASGLDANGGAAKASGGGIKHFLTKPYTAETLLTALRTILDAA